MARYKTLLKLIEFHYASKVLFANWEWSLHHHSSNFKPGSQCWIDFLLHSFHLLYNFTISCYFKVISFHNEWHSSSLFIIYHYSWVNCISLEFSKATRLVLFASTLDFLSRDLVAFDEESIWSSWSSSFPSSLWVTDPYNSFILFKIDFPLSRI